MDELLALQIEWIVALQQHATPSLDAVFRVFTDFGGRYYLLLVPALLWCVDHCTGTRVLVLMALTLFLNTVLKEWIADPRPFQLDERVISEGEEGYGLPSGHAQLVVVFWGAIAAWVGRRGFWLLALGIMFLMGFSRVYLGVHFPTDVLAGWALGALTLWVYLRWREAIEAWLARQAQPALLAVALGVVLVAFDRVLVRDEHFIAAGSGGFLAGAGIAAALAVRQLDFRGHGVWWRRLLRYPVGLALTLPVLGVMQWLGLPDGFVEIPVLFLDLALFAFWIAFAMPWLFGKIQLGDAPATTSP
jgi:membrane-associated phospholipid phosphatase